MEERPREKLIAYGPESLSNAELLAVLLHTGTREQSVLHLAESVLGKFKERGITSIVHTTVADLAGIHGIGPSKAASILAAVELGRSASVVHPREVFAMAIRYAAASMILVHNHPSGDPNPSREDIAITDRLVKAGRILDIPVLDHIILGDNRFLSLKEKGMIS